MNSPLPTTRASESEGLQSDNAGCVIVIRKAKANRLSAEVLLAMCGTPGRENTVQVYFNVQF
ncbi:hypothetical protein D3C84_1007220 [compost metagenome]